MRILISHYSIKDGPGFCRTGLLANGLAKLGNNVTLITTSKNIFPTGRNKYVEIRDNVKIIAFPDFLPTKMTKMGFGFLSLVFKIIFCSIIKFDIVHSDSGHRPSSGWPCIVNRVIFKSTYISEWWDYFGPEGMLKDKNIFFRILFSEYESWTEIHNKKISDGVVALSKYTRERAVSLGIENKKLEVIHGGADILNIKYIPDHRFRPKFDLPTNDLIGCAIGINDSELLDLLPLLESLPDLEKEINLKIITTGEYISKSNWEKYQIKNSFVEFGWIDYKILSELLSCADFFILLLKDNAINLARWPNKLGDYFAAGRIILTNNLGEVSDYTKRYPNSFVITQWDSDSVKHKIKELYNRKSKLIIDGAANRSIAENNLSWEMKSEQLLNFYRKIRG